MPLQPLPFAPELRLTTSRRHTSQAAPRAGRAPCAARAAGHVALLLAPLTLAGCRDAFAGFGTGARARTAAEQMFGSLADRHVELARNAKYEYARIHLSRGALSPSRVYDDTAAWTGRAGSVRLLETFGSVTQGRYLLASRPAVPAPVRPADGRHVTTLARLSDNEYRWETTVDYALGTVRPADVAAVVSRLIAAGEGRTERQARADLAASAPRTSAVLGQLFSLDTLHPTPLADGTTAVTLGIAVHADVLGRRYPAFGGYVHTYVDPARYRFTLTDRAGAPFLDATATGGLLTIRVRTQHGRMVPLAGPPRPMPDSLLLQADLNVKVKVFRVGFHDLSMAFVNGARGDREREWVITARKEPQWDLPFLAARLIRAPLRRPFAGEGALFRLGVRAGEGSAPTVLVRQSRLTVQESAILNFLNSLGNRAMDDFENTVEREENAWLHELFIALRDDARGALP